MFNFSPISVFVNTVYFDFQFTVHTPLILCTSWLSAACVYINTYLIKYAMECSCIVAIELITKQG